MVQDKTYTWIVAYIDVNFVKNVDLDLRSSPEYNEVTAYIPTVKVLKKKIKGLEEFEEVPLLFNYGFFRLPRNLARSKAYLDNMKANIACIFGWVPDPAKTIGKKPKLHDHNVCYDDSNVPIATATSDEITKLVEMARESTIFSAVELDKLKVGDTITLKGYPWEGMDATVIEIDPKKKIIKVNLLLFQQLKEISVGFDSVFFTIYRNTSNYDPETPTNRSVNSFVGDKILDRLTFNLDRDDTK